MQNNLPPNDTPWLVLGDFNEITSQVDKIGGLPFRDSQCKDLDNFIDAPSLMDVGFHGNPFTWSNVREGLALICERLDRALLNCTWLDSFPSIKVIHLPKTHSDHCPILVTTDDSMHGNSSIFPFRCKKA